MKRILIDLYKTKNLYSGLGQFSLNFANELASRDIPGNGLHFLVPENSPLPASEKYIQVQADYMHRYLPWFGKRYDLWHGLQQFPSHFPNSRTPLLLTVHDLNFLTEKDPSKARKYLRRLQKNIDRADFITAISSFTKQELSRHINLRGKPVRVIYNGISAGDAAKAVKPAFAGDSPFFFSIGLFTAKKNFISLLRMMRHVDDRHLIIAGDHRTPYGREIVTEIGRLGLGDKVILPGKISEAERTWLYAHCEAFLFPSLAEGFGMPVIEAMAFGKPVFLSRYGSLPEIGADLAFYFDDLTEEAMALLVREMIGNKKTSSPEYTQKVRDHAAQFSWKQGIDEYLKLYGEILETA